VTCASVILPSAMVSSTWTGPHRVDATSPVTVLVAATAVLDAGDAVVGAAAEEVSPLSADVPEPLDGTVIWSVAPPPRPAAEVGVGAAVADELTCGAVAEYSPLATARDDVEVW
jgi:hypothetical protein